ncbi:MAG: DNA-processing protein DprA [Bacteroidales bacterium]|nr:DNA-processing protein DprA [Bacteroidales bacterium]
MRVFSLQFSEINRNLELEALEYKIAFSMAKGMQGDTAREMLRRVGSPQAFFSHTPSQLQTLTGVNSEIFHEEYRKELLEQAHKERVFVDNNNLNTFFIGDENYPQRLADCPDAPAILYECGTANLDSPYIVGIVGTRHATPYGIDFTTRLVTDLAAMFPGIVIVSGLAFGIDVTAHKAALALGTPTIGVVAHGLKQKLYPAEHSQIARKMVDSGGAILTEYPTNYTMRRNSFLERNRIVAGISDCIVVVESDVKGGSLATARIAREYNRDVFALPGRTTDLYSRGTNMLIAQDKARLITCAKDLAADMMWDTKDMPQQEATPTLFRTLNAEEQRVYDFILAHPEATENDMCVQLGLPFARITNILFTLEMEDFILKVPGGRYMPTSK